MIYIARVEGFTVSLTETNVVCRICSAGGYDATDGASVPHDPELTAAEFNAKVVEQLMLFITPQTGDRCILLGGAVDQAA